MANTLEQIYKSALKFLTPLTPEETYRLIVNEANKLMKTQYGSIFLMEQDSLQRIYASNPILHQIKIRKRGTTYKTFKTHKANVIDARLLQNVHPQFKELEVKSIISIPLSYLNKSIGVLSLQSTRSESFTSAEFDTLKLFGSFASLAIRKAQLYDETQKALEARDLFISMAAHELKTPITTISGYSQLLYSKFATSNTAEARWIEGLSWEVLRLTYLVKELLEMDQIKTGQFEYVWKECSLKEVIKRVLSDFHFTHPAHKVIFEDKVDGQDLVIGDFNKLLQLVINLLDNAAKFSPQEKEIFMELKANSKNLHLTIKDQGQGIPTKYLPEVFEKFFKGSDQTPEGMGVGLFLVKSIVKQHRGEIKIYSKEKRGTKVEVKLPKAKI